jgi:hypothetical protein
MEAADKVLPLEPRIDHCPVCGADTDSLKTFDFPHVVFLVIAHSHRVERVTACPGCLRRYLLRWGSLSVVTANLLWPVLIFPLLISRLFASFLPGHRTAKKSILKKLAAAAVGILLVASAFALGIGIVGMFGPLAQDFFFMAAVAAMVMVGLGAMGAVVDL